jgi:aspartate kinase
LSVSGIGLRSHTSVAIALFKALADVGINVLMTNTSELRVNVVIEGKDAQRGLAALKETFASALI